MLIAEATAIMTAGGEGAGGHKSKGAFVVFGAYNTRHSVYKGTSESTGGCTLYR